MKIAIDGRTYFLRSGSGRYTRGVVNTLVRRYADRHHLTVLLSNHKQEADFPLSAANLSLQISRAGLNQFEEEEKFLAGEINGCQPDVVFFPFFILPAGVEAPCVTSILDLTFVRLAERHMRANIDYLLNYLPQSLSRAAALVTISDFVRDDLFRYAADNAIRLDSDAVHRIYPGVDEVFFQPAQGADEDVLARYGLQEGEYFLYVGSIEARKNVDGLLRAYGSISGRIAHPLVIVGLERWGVGPAREALDALEKPERVLMPGYLEDDQVAALYRNATALVYPSISEGFGLPVAEAYACGTPVITSATSSLGEIGSVALLVDPRDESQIAAALIRVAQDERLREKMATGGLEQARQFTWDRSVDQLMALFESVQQKQQAGGDRE